MSKLRVAVFVLLVGLHISNAYMQSSPLFAALSKRASKSSVRMQAEIKSVGDVNRRQLLGLLSAGLAISGLPLRSNAYLLGEDEQVKLFDDAVPSVCFISTEYTTMAQQLNLGADNLPKGVGTGFVWDNLGHIVTNFHVINKVDTALVTLTTKKGETKQYTAKLTGVDPDKDIAVLKIDANQFDLRPIPLGTAKSVKVGQYALAIGNPFGQDHTLTTGVISGKNREITAPTGRKIKGILQTDAAINPGNSGGPLLDSAGRLIGINTASLGSGVSAGVGFALPVDAVRVVVDQIIQFGAVQRAILGITYLERLPTPAEAERSGLPRIERGVVVLEVPNTSPALVAGLQGVQRSVDPAVKRTTVGDVIVGIDDKKIDAPPDLTAALESYKPGDKIKLKVLRGPSQEPKTLTVALGSFRGSTFTGLQSERAQVTPAGGPEGASVQLNVPLGEIAPQITPRMPDGPVIP